MRSLVAPRYCDPSGYEVVQLPVPDMEGPDDVLIKVHAASISGGETKLAKGTARFIVKARYVSCRPGVVCADCRLLLFVVAASR